MKIETSRRVELIDITDVVKEAVETSDILNGICVISTTHTTTSIIVNENESGLRDDILNLLERLVPPSAGYQHDRIDDNADSHLKAVLLGSSEAIPIIDGKLVLGTWQSIFFAEMDGPRHRKVNIMIIRQS
ncbi:secondary thiamine-phosphate synthase enzyme YjbQ [Methanolobus sp. ZRKC3]|uniref:secondary thiamine-phosphate synthase enzyme YjbQ n=1 Tax=Methanolobus sp. ZRKC3 TaxID=3125786 RepID=UPI0032444C5E